MKPQLSLTLIWKLLKIAANTLSGTVAIADPEGGSTSIVSIDTTEAQYGTFSFQYCKWQV